MRIRRIAKRDNDVSVVRKIATQSALDEIRKLPRTSNITNVLHGGGGAGFGSPLPDGSVYQVNAVAYGVSGATLPTYPTIVQRTYIQGLGAVHLYDDAANNRVQIRLNILNNPIVLAGL